MIHVKGYAAQSADSPISPFSFERRDPGPHDVQIEILYCGVCHSDLHQARNDWGNSLYPMVPGHEIVGRVVAAGSHVARLKVGDFAGVGCMVTPAAIARRAKPDSSNIASRELPGPTTHMNAVRIG
jgi:alcohol dehydrogenase (NADP+)